MKLIIAEKPSLGRSIADAIPGTASGRDPIRKGDYCITWLYGHILSLKEPQDYNKAYAKWSLEQLPISFPDWAQKPADGKEERLQQIGGLLKEAELVIHAGDPDDEGQLLVDEVLRWFHYAGPVKRLDTANTTEAALTRALAALQDNGPREADGWAAYARSVADLLVGVNMSRFFTCSNRGRTLTVGRVQTPTLGLVVNRDLLIEQHEKVLFYTVTGELEVNGKIIPCSLQLEKDDPRLTEGRLTDAAEAAQLARRISGITLHNVVITNKSETEKPPLPFNLVKLQTYCGNAWGYDPQQVMDITQRLKDSGAITYNRSDCQYLSSDHFKEAPKTAATVCKNLGGRPPRLDTTIRSAAFNDKYITAHFAIIPTDSKRDLSAFSEEEKNVYSIIARYYLAQFMPNCVKRRTTLSAVIPELGTLTASSTEILDQGFHELLPSKADPPTPLSGFSGGTYSGTLNNTAVQEKETKPPARYTKTSLNEDMTRIARYVEDPRVKQLLLEKDRDKKGENGSIGTSATRASIIDGLVLRGFLEEKNKRLISTEMGREFYRILPDELKKPDMTAYWWVIQEQIKTGELPRSALPDAVLDTIKAILKQSYPLLSTAARIPADRTVLGRCPRCGGYVVEGSKGYGCLNYKNGCKFTIWKQTDRGVLKNVTITPKMAEALLSGDTVESKRLYSEKNNACFFGGLRLEDRGSDHGAGLQLVLDLPRPVLGKCPRCGGDIIEGKAGFGCANYKDGCKFTIWKQQKSGIFQKITISEAMAKKLLAGETITTKRLWSEKKQTEFFGGFRLRDQGSKYGADLELVMDLPRPVLGKCPRCGGDIIEGKGGFGCANYKDGCKFTIWKQQKSGIFQKLAISEAMAKKLLAGETITTKHLWSEKKQTEFFGGFRLRDQGSEYGADLELITDLPRPVLGKCPRCGGDIIEGKAGFGCANYKNGCKFTIWKKAKSGPLQAVTITEAIARKLLAGESVDSTKLTVKNSDGPQSGSLRLADKGSDFGADLEIQWAQGITVGSCPRCGKKVRETPLSFRCSGYSDGCSYSIWKHPKLRMFSDITITADMAKILMRGDTIETDLLYSVKKGHAFKGSFRLKDEVGPYGPNLELLPFTAPVAASDKAAPGSSENMEPEPLPVTVPHFLPASPSQAASDLTGPHGTPTSLPTTAADNPYVDYYEDYVWPDDNDAPPEASDAAVP